MDIAGFFSENQNIINMILEGIGDSVYMIALSTLFGYILGLPMGIALAVTDKDGIAPNPVVYKILDIISNLVRSIPFIILLVLLIPFTRTLIGRSTGPTAMIVSLTICAAPYIGRMVESSLKEVDPGVIEAARSMGATNWYIIIHVLLLEARTSLIVGATICCGTILGYTAMAGTVGGGGLGQIAINYGYYRWDTAIMIVTVILIIILFQIIQTLGMYISRKLDKRK